MAQLACLPDIKRNVTKPISMKDTATNAARSVQTLSDKYNETLNRTADQDKETKILSRQAEALGVENASGKNQQSKSRF